jgi:hypothetical protein
MKIVSAIGCILLFLFFGCEKQPDNTNNQLTAEIVGFDMNCSTCILRFPEDSLVVKSEIGKSPYNYYQTVNLVKGDFEIGQILKVRVRKAKDTELNACITMYPSYNYENVYVLDYEKYNNLKVNDTIDLKYKDCLYDSETRSYICFDTVITDSRCPKGGVCVWEGNAAIRMKLEKSDNNQAFADIYEKSSDLVFSRYYISFLQLLPYPTIGNQVKPEDYVARLIIRRK